MQSAMGDFIINDIILFMDRLKLIKPNLEYKEKSWDFRNECLSESEEIHGDGGLDKSNNFEEWLENLKKESSKDTCGEKWVPATTWLVVRESDKKIVGVIQLRHELNDFLLNRGGHIGYEVRPSERRKGYATEMLRLVLMESKKIGLKKVLVSCTKSNIASAKTIIKNGGVLEDERIWTDGSIYQRYWIEIN
ncbi:hypothetical protein SDC9_67125 [bioreactor metagenome]|uniref:N-acetyltransferase domain-containing protein n=1 Tax=bioreactor metagenome TaxID=1076179 RepID=A0A644XX74_9ZZZZ